MRLPEPRVRPTPRLYSPHSWPVDRRERLPPPRPLKSGSERRSHREFKRPPLPNLSTLLWHTARRQESLPSPEGLDLSLRPVPSAGAIHPIHILIEHPVDRTWTLYNPLSHTLDRLVEQTNLLSVRHAARRYIDPGVGALVVFAAEPGLTEAKYEQGASLLWRDAGVLQGAMTLLAPQAGLVSCLLGLSGDSIVSTLGQQDQLVGAGTAVLGGAG